MFKKLKYISILSIALFYILHLCILFSGALIENIQQIRHQNQIAKTHIAEQKILTIEEWNTIDNEKEIKIHGIYYDVINFKVTPYKVIVKVVKDDFESELRISMQRLFNNKSLPSTDKKKCFDFYNYLSTIEKQKNESPSFLSSIETNPNSFFIQKETNTFISSIYRPPC